MNSTDGLIDELCIIDELISFKTTDRYDRRYVFGQGALGEIVGMGEYEECM